MEGKSAVKSTKVVFVDDSSVFQVANEDRPPKETVRHRLGQSIINQMASHVPKVFEQAVVDSLLPVECPLVDSGQSVPILFPFVGIRTALV